MLIRTPSATLCPYTTLFRSPLRIMRAARFSAQLEFDVDPDAMTAMTAMAERLSIVSAERVRGERSEEHTSELQSRGHLVCRHLLKKKNKRNEKKESRK